MPKAEAWREKNRLAQKAFRQRQKVGSWGAALQLQHSFVGG